jgi:hypothetical protein
MFDLTSLFTKESMIRRLKSLPVLKTPVMDAIFTDRPQLPLPVVSADMVRQVARTMPVIRRGAPSIPATSVTGEISFYEPLPVRPNVQVTGQDLNNLKVLNAQSKEAWAVERTELLRRAVRATVEGMCSVAMTGTLTWPVKLEAGGYDSYSVVFGSPLSVTPTTLWSAGGAKLKDVFKSLSDMEEALEAYGYGSNVVIWAGKTAYDTLFGLAEASVTTAKIRVEITDQGINVGGFLVRRRAEKWRNPQTGALTAVVPDNDVWMIDLNAGHKLVYCAVDDLDANLQALPLFVKPVKLVDPSGYKLIAESKPFPLPNVEGICEATVYSPS